MVTVYHSKHRQAGGFRAFLGNQSFGEVFFEFSPFIVEVVLNEKGCGHQENAPRKPTRNKHESCPYPNPSHGFSPSAAAPPSPSLRGGCVTDQ